MGAAVARDLFGTEPPSGSTIVLGDWVFHVVGVLAWVSDPDGPSQYGYDSEIFIPFSACAAAFRGNATASSLRFHLREPGTDQEAMVETKVILDRRRLQRGETNGTIRLFNSVERMELFTKVITGLKLLVGLVGGIGLFVGAVGVANVLLVSVRERTMEIGVRRALGATRRAVFVGFLLEALAITLLGGLAGILVAYALTKIALFIPAVPVGARPHITLFTAATAVSLLTLVGLVAGVGPARRAAAVYPAEALRAE
jgi:putative ABC transport system permease protein